MALSLPRGLGPVRLLIVSVVLVSLLLFRSYYLPDPDAESGSGLASSPGPWWRSQSSSTLPEDTDVDLEDGYYEFDDDPASPSAVDGPVAADFEQEPEGKTDEEAEPEPEPEPKTGPTYASGPTVPAPASAPASAPVHAFEPHIPACRQLPGADKVVVMVKTGATEVFVRVPELLVTLAECAPNFMIFSDMEQHIGEFHIQDALDEIGQEYKESHEDFQFYNAIRAAHHAHGDVSVLGSDKAWALDKWKNIPMLHKAYLKYPDAEWFITIDADTYLSWANLLLLLDRMDPEDPLYAGCVYWHGPTAFAQGGTGYLLSRKAVQRFEAIRTPEKIADWEKETSTICCGDVMLGVAMGHAGVSVSGAWPMFQVDPPSGYLWGDRTWCTPAITWHHVHSYEVEALWQFEQEWLNKTWDDEDPGAVPYLFKDVFEDFVMPHISEKKKDWNNGSGDKTFTEPKEGHVKEDADWDWKNDEEKQKMWDDLSELEKGSVESADKCREVCDSDPECVQFSWHPGTCKLSHSIKMGRPVDGKEEYISGWMLERVEEFKNAREECGEISWQIG
ncbi:hypothetical protein G647_09286 [Cladophialophora carrionii CBS 160.54]|uniref:N-acetylgalactosaminide beta-1,3-galactosyltransferase n=1 Tax=Cladophialophora carrionii CBS 160.54 TaxID=1279043 RepID=V9D0G4_9EURO|nr:uncharacterized protein G647_09286 [Cladophialophora carrionii CBS 160.54]ETI19452.1 hypothetical protein G647_09286 [Cladophialophora carrionii CBS 160.54]